jgi:DNA recombination protein RmuC
VKSQTETVLKTLDGAQTRSRAVGRVLRQVEALPEAQAQRLIPNARDTDSGDASLLSTK